MNSLSDIAAAEQGRGRARRRGAGSTSTERGRRRGGQEPLPRLAAARSPLARPPSLSLSLPAAGRGGAAAVGAARSEAGHAGSGKHRTIRLTEGKSGLLARGASASGFHSAPLPPPPLPRSTSPPHRDTHAGKRGGVGVPRGACAYRRPPLCACAHRKRPRVPAATAG